jgi:putative ABC transport system permease protein
MNGVKGETNEETGRNIQLLQQELERFPFVETSATSMSIPIGYSGTGVSDDDGNVLFSSRYEMVDYNYIPLMQMEFVSGGNFTGSGQVIVTENFVKKMGWKDNPVGKEVKKGLNYSYGKIVGVLKDYVSSPLYEGSGYDPVLLQGRPFYNNMLTIRFTEITPGNLKALNDKLVELYPDDEMGLTILKDLLDSLYAPVLNFRNITLVACICIFLITLMGLIGYVSDEIQRRRKEIALRKINGATVANGLALIVGNLFYMALPAILIAAVGAYFAGEQLLQMFTEKTALNAAVFFEGIMSVLLIITAVATVKSWQAANENPAKTIIKN